MTEGDMPRGEFLRRLGGMLALNFASVLAMTSPLWLTTAFRRANTYWTIAGDPSAPPEEVEAKMRRFRTPPLSEALWRDAALVALPYVAWAVVLHLVHGAFHRPRSRSDRLDHWAAAGRFRLAYMLFWPVPFFGLLMVAFVDDFLLAALRRAGRSRRSSATCGAGSSGRGCRPCPFSWGSACSWRSVASAGISAGGAARVVPSR